jgi:microcystin-dependent protein
MATPFLGELRTVAFNFPPRGWAFCNGQMLQIAQNQALYSILGTTYGGNGTTTFALPNLQGATPMHTGGGMTLGQRGGEANHTLSAAEMPAHSHAVNGNSGDGNVDSPAGNVWAPVQASASTNAYSTAQNGTMSAAAVGPAGGSQPHDNMQPYLVVNVIIALVGIFPSRN